MQYSRRKFVGALALGRGLRFLVVAGLGMLYGNAIVKFFARYYRPALALLIGAAVVGAVLAYLQYRKMKNDASPKPVARAA
jgi:membrane protein DedA with SNARE-associated domain